MLHFFIPREEDRWIFAKCQQANCVGGIKFQAEVRRYLNTRVKYTLFYTITFSQNYNSPVQICQYVSVPDAPYESLQ